MDFFEVIAARHSARLFSPGPLAADELDAVLGAARRAPSAGNLQSWCAVVVESAPSLEPVAAATGESFVCGASGAIVFAADPTRAAGAYGPRGRELYCVQDATIACTYAQLAAAALGLDSVWLGAFDEDALSRAVNLDLGLRPIAVLVLGRAAEAARATTRRPLDSLVRRIRAGGEATPER